MAANRAKKIVYLFGAGATHAELQNSEDNLDQGDGLLVSNVSSRVIARARRDERYLRDVRTISGMKGSLNIELLISLIENSKVHEWEYKTHRLKTLIQEDIEEILSASRTRRFHLHKALFELHSHPAVQRKEELTGLISLNYDSVLDAAYRHYYGSPHYCFSLDTCTVATDGIPLLKLHGSFNWRSKLVHGRRRTIEIIPLGSTKSYMHPPYVCIWNQALETLVGCDTLRIIGCSLSPNDVHLIDLLFKAQLERGTAFEMEIIATETAGEGIRNNYGFFSALRTLPEIEDSLVPDAEPNNPFKTWLTSKSRSMLGDEERNRTAYIKQVVAKTG